MASGRYRALLCDDTPLKEDTPCGYCRVLFGRASSGRVEFEADHIVPRSRDPLLANVVSNLVWACIRCNHKKADHVDGYDEQSEKMVSLFNPRKERWFRHFMGTSDGKIHGRSGWGRATAHRLAFNSEAVVLRHRERGFAERWWPARKGWLP